MRSRSPVAMMHEILGTIYTTLATGALLAIGFNIQKLDVGVVVIFCRLLQRGP